MAKPVIFDVSGHAGISTFNQDLRTRNAGKRVYGMSGTIPNSTANNDTAGLPTCRLAQTTTMSYRRPKTFQESPSVSEVEVTGARLKVKKRYATDNDYRTAFDTRWRADDKGMMALFLSRKSGHAHLETNPDKLDMISTFHRERALGHAGPAWIPDNLCNDSFLTGTVEANTSDVLKPPVNRAPPYSNPDGPFETSPVGLHSARVDHLDRACVPREDTPHVIEGEEHAAREGRCRMKVMREKSHIIPLGGHMIGDNRPPALADVDSTTVYGRAGITAPWSKGSILDM